MQLKNGLYFIASLSAIRDGGKGLVSRNLREDRSLLPKPIAIQPDGGPEIPWNVKQVGSNNYILSNNGAPTCAINNKVLATLLNIPPPEEWVVTAQPQHGKDIYTVETKYRDAGWVLTDTSPSTVLAVRPLIVVPSLPPRFPEFELFQFQLLGPEDL